jgi:hypothetical protein
MHTWLAPAGLPCLALFPQYEESRKQAERNKQVGKATNMKLSLF